MANFSSDSCGNGDSKPHNFESRWLTAKEAAGYLKCSESFLSIDRMTHIHGVPFRKLGRHVRYDIRALDEWMDSGKKNTLAEA